MARLRYNGLSTTLGGSLTNVATSVTFAAALTHSNGTNVPTIVAPDYIPLAILGATGHLSEIVYLTAYTAGATTGTITRGVEGTTAVVHSNGDTVTQAQLTADYTGEGGGDYFKSGRYYLGTFIPGGAWSAAGLTTNTLYLRPFWLPARRAFDRIGINVTTAATASSGGLLRFGIYDTGGGLPGNLLVDAGTISSESAGAREVTISQTLDSGIYWLAIVAQVAAVGGVSGMASGSVPFLSGDTAPPTGNPPLRINGPTTVTGALPSTLSTMTASSSIAHGIALRAV